MENHGSGRAENGLSRPLPNNRWSIADLAAGLGTLLALVCVACVLVARGGVFFSQWAPDLFIPLEGVLHIKFGQWPHRGFTTPVGSAWYWINAIPALVMPLTARVVIWANLIVALVAGLATLIIGWGKLPRWLVSLCAFYVGMVALSPRQIGESFYHISNNASYNRYCWSLICVVALAALLPSTHRPARQRECTDGVVAGLMIALCFYIKITFAAAGIGFLGLALVTTRGFSGWRFAASAAVVAATTTILVGLATGDLTGYFADLKTAFAVLHGAAGINHVRLTLVDELPGLVLVGLVVRFAAVPSGRSIGPYVPGIFAAVMTVAAGIAIALQNHPEPENPLMALAPLLGWLIIRSQVAAPLRLSPKIADIIMCTGIVFTLAFDLGAVVWTTVAPVNAGAQTSWLAQTKMPDLRIGANYTEPLTAIIPLNDGQILDRWDEAIGVLRPHLQNRRDVTVLPFIWSNPLPLLLGLKPVEHEVAWWDDSRTFTDTLRPSPDVLLQDVDYVLVPKAYVFPDATGAMWAAYGAQVQRDFTIVGHSQHWDLWARKTCARRALC